MSDTPTQIAQIQEIFGTTRLEAEKALRTYGSLDSAVQGLSTDRSQSSGTTDRGQVMTYGPVSKRDAGDGSSRSSQPAQQPVIDRATGTTSTDPIDLTHDEDEALQRALALSMQEAHQESGGHVSQEDRDLSRALEASIQENKRHSYLSILADPLNPNDRRREPGRCVGLKNIGNTCWFSAVIQSLFHLPKFRETLLKFQAPAATTDPVPNCVQFVCELQKLFALLLESNQSYINPKPAINLLRLVFAQGTDLSQQEDVSEFTHKLLEWIEDAFTMSLPKTDVNPMIELFTGESVTEGVINDQPFVNSAKFGAFPVQVEGNADLHDSLEAATVSREMQQETWFSRLPPVLVFSLSRFKFNQALGQAEKLHDRLSFDQLLYLDRYLHSNKEKSRQCRSEVARLRAEITELNNQLESYTHYGGRDIGISDILSLTLRFAESVAMETESSNTAHTESEPNSGPVPKTGTESEIRGMRTCLQRWAKEVEAETAAVQEKLSSCQNSLDTVYENPAMKSVAYRLHAVLVHQGQASGGHYWAYVRKTSQTTCASTVDKQARNSEHEQECDRDSSREGPRVPSEGSTPPLESMSQSPSQSVGTAAVTGRPSKEEEEEDEEMQQDIQASNDVGDPPASLDGSQTSKMSGTSNIASCCSDSVWLKFNDISVQEVDWEEVKRESFGGSEQLNNGNTSAYWLLYISTQDEQTWSNTDASCVLSEAMQQYVAESNAAFEEEIRVFNEKRQSAQSRPSDLSFIKPAKSVRFAEQDVFAASDSEMEAFPSGAKRARSDSPSPERMQVDSMLPAVEIDQIIVTQLEAQTRQRYHRLKADVVGLYDPRLFSEFHYAQHCGASNDVVNAILLQDLARELEQDGKTTLSALARTNLMQILRKPNAASCFEKRLLTSSLCHSIQSFSLNSDLVDDYGGAYAFNHDLLGLSRAHALLEVSCTGTESFRAGDVRKGLSIGDDFIVPGIKAFMRCEYQGDDRVLEQVRAQWCKCLDQRSLTEEDSDLLADLLLKIMEDFTKVPDIIIPDTPTSFDLPRLAAQLSGAVSTACSELKLHIGLFSAAFQQP